ncbi:FMN-binding protein [Anaerosporobacter faecicola]|uniref:FMN-binding protein n=1 Tax=Anaerosporobacter faecicola TaxID=2718714 RepID=UPI0014388B4D|nr:FMN-binding protein [Anaerosporobacter faecicola]
MGIITGYVLLLLLAILCMKFFAKRLGWKKLDRALYRIHKPVAYIAGGVTLLHLVLTFRVFYTRPLILYIGGIAMLVVGILIGLFYVRRKQLGKRWLLFHQVGVCVLLGLLCIHIVVYFVDFQAYKKSIDEISIPEIDVTNIADGTYVGSYDAGYIYAKVEVTIVAGKITNLQLLEHRNERGAKAEAITGEIMQQQKIAVDTISGATNSSRVIQKAVCNALQHEDLTP